MTQPRMLDRTSAGSTPPGSAATPTWPYAVAAVLAAVAGIAVGQLVAAVVVPSAAPVLAVGSVVIDATPTPVKEWAVSTFGTSDKAVLLGSVTLVTLALAAGIGRVARRRRTVGLVLLVALASLAGLAALTRPDASTLAIVPALATALTGPVSASQLWRRADGWMEADGWAGSGGPDGRLATGRRTFLNGALGVGAVAVAGGVGARALSASNQAAAAAAAVRLPTPAHTLPALPTGLEAKDRAISALVTPNADFYRIDTALSVPSVDVAGWTLTIDGSVDHPLTVRWAELLAMPMVEADITLCCVSNEVGGDLISSARWTGVRTRDLLARAGIRAGVDQILSTSVDGMTISTPVQALTDDRDALVAVAMNGVALPPAHGFPARLVTPGLYGFTGATKWLARMTATTYAAAPAYWTERGWAVDAPVITQSRIDTPRAGSRLVSGPVVIGGVAWAQHRGILGVEVRVDDGPWQRATLGPDAGIDYWRQWYLVWDAAPGSHTLSVRATDNTGALQVEAPTDVLPRGATGWHTVSVSVS